MENIYYIVTVKDEFKNRLKLTTINKTFCGKFIKQSYKNVYFRLNGGGALVIIPEEWVESCAPAKILWRM